MSIPETIKMRNYFGGAIMMEVDIDLSTGKGSMSLPRRGDIIDGIYLAGSDSWMKLKRLYLSIDFPEQTICELPIMVGKIMNTDTELKMTPEANLIGEKIPMLWIQHTVIKINVEIEVDPHYSGSGSVIFFIEQSFTTNREDNKEGSIKLTNNTDLRFRDKLGYFVNNKSITDFKSLVSKQS